MRTFVVIALCAAFVVSALSQQLSSQTRAQSLAAAFNKHKSGVKQKYGVRTEKYKDVQSEPAVKQNLRDYSGTYEVGDFGYVINIQVGSNGNVEANGSEPGQQSRTFRLENAKIDGALLTASKVYQDGSVENFEGVFLNRTSRNSPTDPGVTTFGLGVIPPAPVSISDQTYDKLFYQLKH